MKTIKIILATIALLFLLSLCFTSENQIDKISDADPNGLMSWRTMMRSHNADAYKVHQIRKEIRKQNQGSSNTKDAGLNEWESLGPDLIAGRVRAIAVHPTDTETIFVGGTTGGIWKSTDGGNNWTPKSDFNPSLAVTSIIIKPSNPNIMFASTGEGILALGNREGKQRQALPGAGILMSEDGGETWNLIPGIDDSNIDNFYWVNQIVFHPSDDTKIFAGTSDKDQNGQNSGGSVWMISGDGATVELAYNGITTDGGVLDLEVHPDHDFIFAGYTRGAAVLERQVGTAALLLEANLKGFNGFASFPKRVELAISASNSDIVYALCEGDAIDFGFLYRSSDNGQNWQRMDLNDNASGTDAEPFKNGGGGNQGWYNNAIWVDPLNSNNLIIGGINVWRSSDGGDNFDQISNSGQFNYGSGPSLHADHHIFIEASDYGIGNRSVYFGSDGGIAHTSSIGTVTTTSGWNLLNNNLRITQFYASDIRDNGSFIAGAQDNGTSIFIGGSWARQRASDGGYCAFGPIDTTYFSTQNGNFFYEDEFGDTYVLNDLVDGPEFIAPMKVFPFNKRRILMADEKLWITDNPQDFDVVGPYFEDTSPATQIAGITITAIEIGTTGKVVVGYEDGRIYRANFASSNTPSWTQIDQGLFSGKVITDLAINPFSSNTIAVSIGGYDDDNIYLSNDNGSTWVPRSNGLPAVHTNTLLWHYDQENWLYAGTDLGVFASEDNGGNWNVSPNFNGISDGPVFTEITNLQWGGFSAATNQAPLYATTYGRGLWRTLGNIGTDYWVDENSTFNFELGLETAPYKTIEPLENLQAHGQTWHIDKGVYPTNSSIVIDKRLGELLITNSTAPSGGINAAIIGEN